MGRGAKICWLAAAAAAALILPAGSGAIPPAGTDPCGRASTREVVRELVADFGTGRIEHLDSLFAPEPDFQWYSSPNPGRRMGRAARRRSTLASYFRARQAHRDRLVLRAFHLTGDGRRWSDFWVELWRSASDFRRGHRFATSAKGAVACREGEPHLIVLSLGGALPS